MTRYYRVSPLGKNLRKGLSNLFAPSSGKFIEEYPRFSRDAHKEIVSHFFERLFRLRAYSKRLKKEVDNYKSPSGDPLLLPKEHRQVANNELKFLTDVFDTMNEEIRKIKFTKKTPYDLPKSRLISNTDSLVLSNIASGKAMRGFHNPQAVKRISSMFPKNPKVSEDFRFIDSNMKWIKSKFKAKSNDIPTDDLPSDALKELALDLNYYNRALSRNLNLGKSEPLRQKIQQNISAMKKKLIQFSSKLIQSQTKAGNAKAEKMRAINAADQLEYNLDKGLKTQGYASTLIKRHPKNDDIIDQAMSSDKNVKELLEEIDGILDALSTSAIFEHVKPNTFNKYSYHLI